MDYEKKVTELINIVENTNDEIDSTRSGLAVAAEEVATATNAKSVVLNVIMNNLRIEEEAATGKKVAESRVESVAKAKPEYAECLKRLVDAETIYNIKRNTLDKLLGEKEVALLRIALLRDIGVSNG